ICESALRRAERQYWPRCSAALTSLSPTKWPAQWLRRERRHGGTAGLGRVGVNLVALGLAFFAAAFTTPERGFGRLYASAPEYAPAVPSRRRARARAMPDVSRLRGAPRARCDGPRDRRGG